MSETISRKFSPYINGAVASGEFAVGRYSDLADILREHVDPYELNELRSTTADWYGNYSGVDQVSIESASWREQDIKDRIDGKRIADELNWDTGGAIVKPCDLLERRQSSRPF